MEFEHQQDPQGDLLFGFVSAYAKGHDCSEEEVWRKLHIAFGSGDDKEEIRAGSAVVSDFKDNERAMTVDDVRTIKGILNLGFEQANLLYTAAQELEMQLNCHGAGARRR
jgi:hypothetical protein